MVCINNSKKKKIKNNRNKLKVSNNNHKIITIMWWINKVLVNLTIILTITSINNNKFIKKWIKMIINKILEEIISYYLRYKTHLKNMKIYY